MSWLWTILYIAFAAVAVWLLAEVLLQYKARLRWRLLAFGGFAAVVVGVVLLSSVVVIALGAAAFAVGQTFVTLSYRRGFAAGWALGGMPGTSRRRREGPPDEEPVEAEPSLEVSDPETHPPEEPPAYRPEPMPDDTMHYGVYERDTGAGEAPAAPDPGGQYAATVGHGAYEAAYGHGDQYGDQYGPYADAHAEAPAQPQYGGQYQQYEQYQQYDGQYGQYDGQYQQYEQHQQYDGQYGQYGQYGDQYQQYQQYEQHQQYDGQYGQYAAAPYGAPAYAPDGYGGEQAGHAPSADQVAQAGYADYTGYAPDPYGQQAPADGAWLPPQRDGEPPLDDRTSEQQAYQRDGYYAAGYYYGDQQQPRY